MPPSNPAKRVKRFRDQVRGMREDHIVQAAGRVLVCSGCDTLRVEDVATACGIAKGTCYLHFGSRPRLIAAAVRRLDEALAKRLSSPPARLTKPLQILEWALLEAVDAQSLTLACRERSVELGAVSLEGRAWPCCLSRVPCPHGGATQSLDAILHWATASGSSKRADASARVSLVLALSPHSFSSIGQHSQPNLRALRARARQLVRQLFHGSGKTSLKLF